MPAPEAADDLAGDAQVLFAAIGEAAGLAHDRWRSGVRAWSKDDGSPVCETDLEVDAMVRQRLTGARPSYGWLSEETADTRARLSCRRLWLVDPIDGTSAFIDGRSAWCLAAALIDRGRPRAAIVAAPARNETYTAIAGGGASVNGRPIRSSSRDRLSGARLMVNRKLLANRRWREPWPHVECVKTTSLALRLCLVASGACDGLLAVGDKSDWDIAAGDLIVHEAGGRVGDLAGRVMIYNRPATRQHGLIAAGAGLFDELARRAAGIDDCGR